MYIFQQHIYNNLFNNLYKFISIYNNKISRSNSKQQASILYLRFLNLTFHIKILVVI